jgi:HlyD family secretion protein
VQKGQVLVSLTAAQGGKPLAVVSPFAARVLGRRVRKGDHVEKGAPLLILEPLDQPLRARLFIPVSDGYQVRTDMVVQVWPTQVRRGEFGYLDGKVRFASIFPLTRDEMLRIVQNDELVQQFSQPGPCLQVVVELTPDADTVSGYHWSSSEGAPVQLYSGMPCEARVIVSKRRPIELVFPGLAGTRGP